MVTTFVMGGGALCFTFYIGGSRASMCASDPAVILYRTRDHMCTAEEMLPGNDPPPHQESLRVERQAESAPSASTGFFYWCILTITLMV